MLTSHGLAKVTRWSGDQVLNVRSQSEFHSHSTPHFRPNDRSFNVSPVSSSPISLLGHLTSSFTHLTDSLWTLSADLNVQMDGFMRFLRLTFGSLFDLVDHYFNHVLKDNMRARGLDEFKFGYFLRSSLDFIPKPSQSAIIQPVCWKIHSSKYLLKPYKLTHRVSVRTRFYPAKRLEQRSRRNFPSGDVPGPREWRIRAA